MNHKGVLYHAKNESDDDNNMLWSKRCLCTTMAGADLFKLIGADMVELIASFLMPGEYSSFRDTCRWIRDCLAHERVWRYRLLYQDIGFSMNPELFWLYDWRIKSNGGIKYYRNKYYRHRVIKSNVKQPSKTTVGPTVVVLNGRTLVMPASSTPHWWEPGVHF